MTKYDVAACDSAFGLSLLGQIEKGKNAVVSPYNIRSALALLYEGATRETAKEIAAVAGFVENKSAQRQAFRSLLDTVNKAQEGYTLKSANGLWVAQDYPVHDAFLKAAVEAYRAKVENADFKNNAEGSRKEVNGWVSGNTEKKIPELFPKGSLNSDTIVVVASALYFKGQWDAKFSPDHTEKQDFTLSTGEKVKVEMMKKGYVERKTPKFQYAEFDGVQAVALPYQGKEVLKVVFLPPQGETVDNLVADLRRRRIKVDITSSMFFQEFSRLELPKHEVRGYYNLVPLLQAMGIERMFSVEDAQFDGISTKDQLFVSGGYHKTFFKTDEEGSEGAAATGFGMVRTTSVQRPREPKEFVADRPFLEAIVHQPTGSVLFLNRIEDPRGN